MKSILFDFGGTIDSDGKTWIDRFFPLYKNAGVDIPRSDFERAFYDSDDRLASRYPLAQADFEETVGLQVRSVLEIIAPERPDLAGPVSDLFLSGCRDHFRRNRPFLENLRKRYRLGIVSNFYGNLEACLDGEDLLGLFDTVADSGSVGAEKPAPGIFLHALNALSTPAEEGVMVGDSIARDMRGAEGLGMSHFLLTQSPEVRCCSAAQTLTCLTELEGRLP